MTLEKNNEKNDNDSNYTSIIEGIVKFRDGKKWKSRWCVMRKLSPVADCIHLQLYRDMKERNKNGQTKASLSLQHFLGLESGFTLDKESNTLAVLCRDVTPVLAFSSAELLLQWRTRAARALGITEARVFPVLIATAPSSLRTFRGPCRLHITQRYATLCLTSGIPPQVIAAWNIADLRRYGIINGRLCFEVGARGGQTEGTWALLAERADKILELLTFSTPTITATNDNIRKQLKLKNDKRLDSSDCSDLDMSIDRLSITDSSIGLGESASVINASFKKLCNESYNRPTSLSRCMSCNSRITSQTNMPGICHSWTADCLNVSRSESDRTSLYSHSSGGTSEYSVQKYGWKELVISSKASSPVHPIVVTPSECSMCMCNIQKKKKFSGPYNNYDIPKSPVPLIPEHSSHSLISNLQSNYDVPKNFKKCLISNNGDCSCINEFNKVGIFNTSIKINNENNNNPNNNNDKETDAHSNYVNIDPKFVASKKLFETCMDLSLALEEFENPAKILMSAGFSQNEIEGLEDIPENEPLNNHCNNTKQISEHVSSNNDNLNNGNQHYICMERQDLIPYPKTIERSNTLDRIVKSKNCDRNRISDSKRKSSSAEFLKEAEHFFEVYKSNSHKDILTEPVVFRNKNVSIMNTEKQKSVNGIELKLNTKCAKITEKENKTEGTLISRFRDSVKIRRSSSAPTKSEKNRDSSSSSDSGISTGSLKYKYPENENFLKTSKIRTNKIQKKAVVSDSMSQLSFQFHELSEDISCQLNNDVSSNIKQKETSSLDGYFVRSPSSCGSETSDYFESMSVYSVTSNDANSRSTTRPRSGREYSVIQPTLRLQAACEHCHVDQKI